MTRTRIAAELLKDCPADEFANRVRIAAAVARGEGLEDILKMPEVERVPDAYRLLAGWV